MIINPSDRVGDVEEYYFSTKLKELAALKADGYDIINLGIGSPDLPPDPVVIDSMIHYVRQNELHGYQSYTGRKELKEAFAAWYNRWYGVSLNPSSEILPLIGSKEGIMHIHMAFLNPGDSILIPNPGYPTYAASARLAGANVQYYNLTADNKWQPDFNQLARMDWNNIKIMWVNYPHMPTGASAFHDTFERLIHLAQEKQFLLCHDNPYSFILNENPQSIMALSGALDVCLELNSLSKALNMAGWRVGCLVGQPKYLDAVLKFKSNMDSGMFAATQFAAVEALGLGEDWYFELNRTYRNRRSIAAQIFNELGCSYDASSVGMFLWGKIESEEMDAFQYSDEILNESQVFITPGGIFGSNGDNYLRISLCQKVDVLSEALNRIVTMKKVGV